jgi:amino acid adenylation domain-containing protein
MSKLRDRIAKLNPEQRARLEQHLSMQSSSVQVEKPPAPSSVGPAPLSFNQRPLWFIDQLGASGRAYNYPEALRLFGTLNVGALVRSINAIVQRHEILRTTYASENGEPFQRVSAYEPIEIQVINLKEPNVSARSQAAARWAELFSQSRMDLASGPLFRAMLLRFDDLDHVLVIATHHIAFDGWSYGLFMNELSQLYRQFSTGSHQPPPLSELRLQYSDFAILQREQLTGPKADRLLKYWKERLGGTLPVLELPFDRPRPATPAHKALEICHLLAPDFTEKVKALCKPEKATLFMLLLTAFKTLLFRYSGETDILVGSPIAIRSEPFTENIGLFVNTLALRTDLSGNPTFREALARVRDTALGAYAHQEMPFEKLVQVLQPRRSAGHSPLVQVNFVLQNVPEAQVALPGLKVECINVATPAAKFDLTFSVFDTPAGLRLFAQFDTDLFDESTIRRMMEHFELLLKNAVRNPDEHINTISILSESEFHKLIVELNDTAQTFPGADTVHQLFEEQVGRNPDAVALVFENERLTYRELNRRANRLAHRLRARGVTLDTPVGVFMERSLEMVIALLGILKAGGAYVPLDPDYPVERSKFMIEDAQCTIVLTQSRLESNIPPHAGAVLILDAECSVVESEPDTNPDCATSPDAACYIIYTSGSTGQPKGVINIHKGVANRLKWMRAAFDIRPDERFMQKTPFSFDVSVWELFEPLICGATLVIARPGGHRDSAYLIDLIEKERITTIHFVPAMLQIFLEESGITRCSSIKRVVCSGEALPYELQQRFFSRMNAELHNLYGPTEASVEVSAYACERGSGRRGVPIGKPIANTRLYVLDAELKSVPQGITGELYIGGVAVARGYLNRPELNAERFIADPFNSERGAKMYKTGDLARVLSDGNIDYLGRRDHQVKIRGFRIELGEIESALARHPAVRDCVVMAADMNGGKNLIAYAVLRTGHTAQSRELRAFLEKQLPLFMVPPTFILLDAFPLTASGKIDRRALPSADPARDSTKEPGAAPRNENERTILTIWQKILGSDRIGIFDNFFELGGHSLLTIQVLSRIRDQLKVDVPIQTFFEVPTVAGLAETLDTFHWLSQTQGSAHASPDFEEV